MSKTIVEPDRLSTIAPPTALELQAFAFFRGMDEDLLRAISGKLTETFLAGGKTLVTEGEPSDAVFFLLSGRCRAYAGGTALRPIHPGEPIGEVGYVAQLPRTASVVTERDCWFLRLGYDDLAALVDQHPRFGLHLARSLAMRLADTVKYRGKPRNRTAGFLFGREIAPEQRSRCERMLAQALGGKGRISVVDLGLVREWFGAGPDGIPAGRDLDLRLSALERESAQLVYSASLDDPPEWVEKCCRQSDHCYIVRRHTADAAVERAERIVLDQRRDRHLAIVLLHDPKPPQIVGTPRWTVERKLDQILHVDIAQPSDWKRLARYVLDDAIGLVLAGGGALYAIHIGVIKALVEAGFAFDHVGGSSAGGCAAVAYAVGLDLDAMAERFRVVLQVKRSLSRYTLPIYGLINPATFDASLQAALEGRTIEDLAVPFFATAVNISRYRFDIIDRGPAWEALRSTASIPGLLPPYCRNGELMSDGAAFDTLPVLAMRDRLRGHVIAVDFADDHTPVTYDYANRPRPLRRLLRPARADETTPPYPLMIDSLMRSFRFSGQARLPDALRACDLCFMPRPPPGAHMLSWSMHHALIEAGHRYALDRLEALDRADDPGLKRIRAALG